MPRENKWFIAYKKRGQDVFDFSNLSHLMPPGGRYYADPFLLGNRVYFEDYDYLKGRIVSVDLTDPELEPRVELEKEHHLSFPHVFGADGRLYMVPEEGALNKIQLYEKKPSGWQVVHTLKNDIHPGDTQVHRMGDYWYLFTTNADDNEIWIERSKDLLGEWEFVYSGKRQNARAAGRIFQFGKQVIRPTQDASEHYGGRVVLKEISMPPYTEHVVGYLEADWHPGLTGFHTFNFNDSWVVLDGRLHA